MIQGGRSEVADGHTKGDPERSPLKKSPDDRNVSTTHPICLNTSNHFGERIASAVILVQNFFEELRQVVED